MAYILAVMYHNLRQAAARAMWLGESIRAAITPVHKTIEGSNQVLDQPCLRVILDSGRPNALCILKDWITAWTAAEG